jgi:hypothetical protein
LFAFAFAFALTYFHFGSLFLPSSLPAVLRCKRIRVQLQWGRLKQV